MQQHRLVGQDEWITARKALLAKEKEFTKQRDRLSAERRALPWVKIEKAYEFDGPDGKVGLADLFEGRSQLMTYHFMFGPDWEAGCPSCSFLADNFDRAIIHMNQRDVSMVAISRTALSKLEAYKKRMGWTFTWLSSLNTDFNQDFGVSFTPEEREAGNAYYNYETGSFPADEAPGLSVFSRDDPGNVFHTYSTYGRGLDALISTYQYLDLAPKGRDEDELSYPMAWIRRHDEYGS
ncbi:MAG: DUF899 domain-containing protein [Pseudomonadota bacterium]